MGLAIHLLGAPHAQREGHALPAPRGHKVWGLLAYLIRREGAASRTHLAALLFEDAEDPLAALRWNLSELRRLLGDTGLRGDVLALSLPPSSYVDVEVVVRGTWVEALCVPGLGGELLEGMSFASSPSFEVWLATERRRLRATAEAVLREAALARLASGAVAEAAELAARLVRLNPLDENFQALLVRSLAAAGDGVGAARQAAACGELFQRELGVPPGATLAAAMRTATASPTARPATGRAAATAQLEAGEAAISAGALDAGLECLRRAIVEADATGDAALRARARVALGGALVHAARGRDEEGATALHEALAVGQAASSPLAAAACGELDGATDALDRSLAMAQHGWTAFAPWPQSLRAEIDLSRGDVSAAAERFEHAFALGCQLGDPCWEGIAGRGLGRVAIARGEPQRAAEILVDTIARCVRLPDAYLWAKGYALDVLCGLAVQQGLPQASAWIDDLHSIAARSGMRELTARSYLHRAALGDSASGIAARLLVHEIDNPALFAAVA